jgi:hypothetical protein
VAEFTAAEVNAADFDALLDQRAKQRAGRWGAVEWQGTIQWRRYLMCKR